MKPASGDYVAALASELETDAADGGLNDRITRVRQRERSALHKLCPSPGRLLTSDGVHPHTKMTCAV